MNIMEQMHQFSDRFGKQIIVNNTTWRYYRLGSGTPILWLPGGHMTIAMHVATFSERMARFMEGLPRGNATR